MNTQEIKIETRRAHGGVNKTQIKPLSKERSSSSQVISEFNYRTGYTYLSTSEAKLDQISEIWVEEKASIFHIL